MKRQKVKMTKRRFEHKLPSVEKTRGKWVVAGLGVLLVLITVLVYLPATQCGYVWDDDFYVTANPLLSAPDGLQRIWFSTDSPSQYFPLVYTSFRFEYGLWGLEPFGYHLTNILLHGVNALLLWLLLRRLSIFGAWLAAAIFAVHPVHVESVAWITERKNVLMAFFFFLSFLAYLSFIERSEKSKGGCGFYILSILLYVLSLLSKTTACTMPAALVLLLWFKRISMDIKRWLQIVPYVLLGIAMGLLTIWWEHGHQGTGLVNLGLNAIDRTLIASHALWFYIGKLVWPVNLAFSYPYWKIDSADIIQYGWLLGCAAVGFCMWYWRKKLGRGFIAAIVFFVAMLLPMLGFLSLYTFTYTYVADHYQYVASAGPIALFVGLGCCAAKQYNKKGNALFIIAGSVILVTLGILTWRQSGIYEDSETLWRDTIEKNPGSWLAQNNLGNILKDKNNLTEAVYCYNKALEANYDYAPAHYNLADVFRREGNLERAVNHYRQALRIDSTKPDVYNNLGVTLLTQKKFDEAIDNFEKALELQPDHIAARRNLRAARAYKSQFNKSGPDH